MNFTRIFVLFGLGTLSACAPTIEKVNSDYNFLTEKPPSTFYRVGDIWGFQSNGVKFSKNLLCSSDPKFAASSSNSEATKIERTLKADSTGDATVDVNAALNALSVPMKDKFPQVNATVDGHVQYARNATFSVTGIRLETGSQNQLMANYRRLTEIKEGQPAPLCPDAARQEHYVVQETLTADVAYKIDWDASLSSNQKAELDSLAKVALQQTAGATSSTEIGGSNLVYGVKYLDPKEPTKLVTTNTFRVGAVRRALGY